MTGYDPGFRREYVFGTTPDGFVPLKAAYLVRPTSGPTDWYQPLAPWRIARTIRAKAVLVRERITDVAYVARHGMPERDDW